ncbi:PepSY domain-containing protein [Nitrobacter vulgaris]|uniref:PepSY domain-containing protein n=1 Tax=Nitrobacter vulgaris TaxID=29421 RepID=UPI003B75C633
MWLGCATVPSESRMTRRSVLSFWTPYSGRELARRMRGNSWPPTAEAIMEFVYALHYRLLLNQIGIWLFGIAALIWTAA